jgi:hypothetical protein
MAAMYPKTVELFYAESKAAREALDSVLKDFRSNATTVLALATGAAAFFGFEDSSKGPFYVAALVAYSVAAFAAARILWPRDWLMNPAVDFESRLVDTTKPPLSDTKARFDLAHAHQVAFESNGASVATVTKWYQGLVGATAAVVLLAGMNVIRQKPEVPDKPTRVILVEDQP